MRPIRILSILEANTITGPAKNLLQFAEYARREQPEPRAELAIALFERRGSPNLLRDVAREAGIRVYTLFEKARFDGSVVPQLRAVLSDFKADVLQSHSVKSHFLVRGAGFHRETPWVAFHHGYTWPDVRMRVYNQLDRWSLRAARAVLTVSRPFRDELVSRGVNEDRITIIHNAIDPQWGTRTMPGERLRLRGQLGIAPDRKVVLSVGRLSREKDHATLIRAMGALDMAPRPHLILVGDGPERRRIESAVQNAGLSDSVTLTGQVATAEPYYGIADVAVLSSLSEGSPNALLEAMASGVPVLATAVGGVPELVTHRESAYLFEPGDSMELARGIEAILGRGEVAAGLALRAREIVITRHTPAARTERLIDVYRAISNAGRPRAALPLEVR